jgi:hypothetical protein
LTPYGKDSYRHLLRLALSQGYRFTGFLDDTERHPRCIYLRHDVDRSLRMAVELAEINASLGVQGTFFLLLRGAGYNLLSYWARSRIQEIQAFGQRVALHYAVPPGTAADDDVLIDSIRSDFEIACQHITGLQPVFAWHDTTPDLIQRGLDLEIPGLVNVYNTRFFERIPYYSDSNMQYTVSQFEALIKGATEPRIHLLLHPLYWIVGGADPFEVAAKTWPYIIREREEEMRLGRTYMRHLPHGIPTTVLDQFVTAVLQAGLEAH